MVLDAVNGSRNGVYRLWAGVGFWTFAPSYGEGRTVLRHCFAMRGSLGSGVIGQQGGQQQSEEKNQSTNKLAFFKYYINFVFTGLALPCCRTMPPKV